jgi:hypothetical protein
MEKKFKVEVQRTSTYIVTVKDEHMALEAFKPVAIRLKKDVFSLVDVAKESAKCYFAQNHAYNTHLFGVGLLRDPNLGVSIKLTFDDTTAVTKEIIKQE